jgi:hypothetical protein
MKFLPKTHQWSMLAAVLLGLHINSAKALESDVSNALQTIGGIYSSIYIHKIGHALAYKAFGDTDISIQAPPK